MMMLALVEKALGAPVRRLSLRRGGVVFREGDPARAVYGVELGAVSLVRHTVEGRAVVTGRARAGETLAEGALFSERYHCDAVAEAECRVAVYPKAALLAALQARPELGLAWAQALTRQVQALRARLEVRGLRSARERVLAWLAGAPPEERPLKDLAADLALTPEALSRTLAALERAGLVQRQGRRLRLS